jgi:hypothetical protein
LLIIISMGAVLLFSYTDILFSLVGRVFHEDDWTNLSPPPLLYFLNLNLSFGYEISLTSDS